MAESPTPETGTPESQSPARTPPALITTEELLQSIEPQGPEEAALPEQAPTSASVSRVTAGPPGRYQRLRFVDASHKLQGALLPPEEELRAVALGGLPAVGPPPRLPHQLSPALQAVLVGWRSVYESCTAPGDLQALVGECYAREAVFEDAVVSARGQEAIYRQFALLGAAVQAVQVGAYSLSVTPLARPVISLPVATGTDGGAAGGAAAAAAAPATQRPGTRPPPLRPVPPPAPVPGPPQAIASLPLTRVTVENVQLISIRLPALLSWLVGCKADCMQVPLYVTSILLVASDAPLAMAPGGGREGLSAAEATARRLAGAAAALAAGAGGASSSRAVPEPASATATAAAAAAAPSWRIVHHVDKWHNVPLVWWKVRRMLCRALDRVATSVLNL